MQRIRVAKCYDKCIGAGNRVFTDFYLSRGKNARARLLANERPGSKFAAGSADRSGKIFLQNG
jgi:hypothetical protein